MVFFLQQPARTKTSLLRDTSEVHPTVPRGGPVERSPGTHNGHLLTTASFPPLPYFLFPLTMFPGATSPENTYTSILLSGSTSRGTCTGRRFTQVKQLARKWLSEELSPVDVPPNYSNCAAPRLSHICPSSWNAWGCQKFCHFSFCLFKKEKNPLEEINLLGNISHSFTV